jgi:antitoxin component of MazEF toxin-antitoxin module
MATIPLHYDGWLHLPAEVYKHLNVSNGDRLEVEVIDDALVLHPARQADRTMAPEPAVAEDRPAAAPAEAETAASKRGPGRPRKLVTQDPTPHIKVGGRRKSTPSV